MNFLIVVPGYAPPGRGYHFPLGLAYVSSVLKQRGFNVFNLNLCHREEPAEIALKNEIGDKAIDVVLTGGLSLYWNEIGRVLTAAKKAKKDVITVAGGPVVTATPALFMQNMPADYGVIGEGELTAVELASALAAGAVPEKVHGLVYRDPAGGLITTPPRAPIDKLDDIPFPDYEGMEFDKLLATTESEVDAYLEARDGPRPAEVIVSRSCPFNCTFCYHPLGRKYRQRSLPNLFSELDYLKEKFGVNVINFLDELLAPTEKRLAEFADGIKRFDMPWAANLRVDRVTSPILKKMKESGAFLVFFGVESVNDRVLKSMNKNITREQIDRAFQLALKTGLRANGHLILGDVADTEETMRESIGWWIQHHGEYNINLDFILAIPDSPIYRRAVETGLIKNELAHIRNRFPVVNLTSLDDRVFFGIFGEVNYYNHTKKYIPAGRVLSTERSGNRAGRPLYALRAECPACGAVAAYTKQVSLGSRWYALECGNCHKRYKVSALAAFPEYRMMPRHFLKTASGHVKYFLRKSPAARRIGKIFTVGRGPRTPPRNAVGRGPRTPPKL